MATLVAIGYPDEGGERRIAAIVGSIATVIMTVTAYGTFGVYAVIALAVVVVWNDLLLRTVMPVLVLFNTLPKID